MRNRLGECIKHRKRHKDSCNEDFEGKRAFNHRSYESVLRMFVVVLFCLDLLHSSFFLGLRCGLVSC